MQGRYIAPHHTYGQGIDGGPLSSLDASEEKLTPQGIFVVIIVFLLSITFTLVAASTFENVGPPMARSAYGDMAARSEILWGRPDVARSSDPFTHFVGAYPYTKEARKMRTDPSWQGDVFLCPQKTLQELTDETRQKISGSQGTSLGAAALWGHGLFGISIVKNVGRIHLGRTVLTYFAMEPEHSARLLDDACESDLACTDAVHGLLQYTKETYEQYGKEPLGQISGPNAKTFSREEFFEKHRLAEDFVNSLDAQIDGRISKSLTCQWSTHLNFFHEVLNHVTTFEPEEFSKLVFAMIRMGPMIYGATDLELKNRCDLAELLTLPGVRYDRAAEILHPIFENVRQHLPESCRPESLQVEFLPEMPGPPVMVEGVLQWRRDGFSAPFSMDSWTQARLFGAAGSEAGKLLGYACPAPERDGLLAAANAWDKQNDDDFLHGFIGKFAGNPDQRRIVNSHVKALRNLIDLEKQ